MAAANGRSSTRRCASACEETSIAHAPLPLSAISRKSDCTSGASGVVRAASRVVGPIRRTAPVEVRGLEFLRSHTTRRIKVTLPGAFSMSVQASDDYYGDPRACALAYAEAVKGQYPDNKDPIWVDFGSQMLYGLINP